LKKAILHKREREARRKEAREPAFIAKSAKHSKTPKGDNNGINEDDCISSGYVTIDEMADNLSLQATSRQ
jgi:anaerobic ribonucleoside-triphosphate reductase